MAGQRRSGFVMFVLGMLFVIGIGVIVIVVANVVVASGNGDTLQFISSINSFFGGLGAVFSSGAVLSAVALVASLFTIASGASGAVGVVRHLQDRRRDAFIGSTEQATAYETDDTEEALPGDSGTYPSSAGSENPVDLVQAGLAALKAGDKAMAIERFTRATEQKPPYPKAFSNLAAVLYTTGKYEDALKYITQVNETLDPGKPMHLILQAKILRAMPGNEQKALMVALKAVDIDNAPSDAWRLAGQLSYDVGHYAAAERYYTHITNLIEQGRQLSLDVYRDLGDVRLRRGNLSGALQAYDTYLAVPRYQRDYRVKTKRAQVLLDLGRKEDALAAAESALADNQAFGPALRVHADTLRRLGRRKEAREDRSEAVALERENARGQANADRGGMRVRGCGIVCGDVETAAAALAPLTVP